MSNPVHQVTGTDDVALHVREFGDPDGLPILFLHGYAQSLWCWRRQLESRALTGFRLVAFDLRGHGRSGRPDDARAYNDARLWAGDVQAVIETLRLDRPVIAAWSYSGLILCDYLRHRGDGDLAGLAFVSARTMVGDARARAMSGPLFVELVPGFQARDATAREAAVQRFLENLTAGDITDPDFYTMLGYNLAVSPEVCTWMLDRVADNDDVLGAISVPTLVVHGDADTSVLPAMAAHNANVIPGACYRLYPGVGHAPFWEATARFDTDLAALRRDVV